jgi:hypothetical protein
MTITRVGQHRFERFEIGVDVGENGETHGRMKS